MDSMYPSEGGETPAEETPPETIDEEEAENASKTALIPKTMLPNCKVGDIERVRVVADHGDELELEPVGYSDKKKEKSAMSDDEELDAMGKEY